jgi:hypothetical protein
MIEITVPGELLNTPASCFYSDEGLAGAYLIL